MVAVVTENPRLRMNWRGDDDRGLSAGTFLDTNGVTQHAKAEIAAADPARELPHERPA